MEEEIVYGSALKMRGNDIVEGHLVLFGDKNKTDKSAKRDYFTAETDFGLDLTTKTRILYQHGLDPKVGKTPFGIGEMKIDEWGVWFQGQLKVREEYEQHIAALENIKQLAILEKLGLSSGTAAHLVEREKQSNGAHWVKTWYLGLDASLTPNPAEPRTVASIKSLIESLKSEGLSDGDKKRMIEAALRSRYSSTFGKEDWLYVCDIFASSAIFEMNDGTFEVSYELTDAGVTLGEPFRVVRVSQYKPVEAMKNERDFEKFLRDAGGFSAREAKTIISQGFKPLSSRDAGDTQARAALEAAKSAYLATERKLASVLSI